ncbi:bifunctional helix-turn-helix transcriptional regulator/GNAT family N-acetyltransferase [Shewanella litorisediminis]|uniref:GNAT family N-acetyltransferase n=1 Tax=Shewanella litorisediminis TaxID=1173586 RepID=A0ABX7G130_9GAMM|nr:bifunctional helix-turn-helix transcriptional regulator/GNAT family N-acetyltransferase [Shewanella litorisediminis]MCL2918968.1 bifunctional helix-turn-helix transcriptional regulator/GNAT family N-acetyltransferase [Shewanella litorisediminis]QRH01035.1 GNAT family N-acetyltransferase [Shewanella litorisediminis]
MVRSTQVQESQAREVRQLSRQLIRQLGMLAGAVGKLPLSPVQAHALIELGQQSLSIKQLAHLLNIDKSNASRAVTHLVEKKLVETRVHQRDSRSLQASLTPRGRTMLERLDEQQDNYFLQVLAQLTDEEAGQIALSLGRFQRAIVQAKAQDGIEIRPLTPDDDVAIAAVIREVSAEYGLTPDKGYGVADKTLDCLSEVYSVPGAAYWVICQDGQVLGGGGIAPLASEPGVCELQKMYFLPVIRGKGLARRLANHSLAFARQEGYQACYLETTAVLHEAVKLYESLGFEHLTAPMGNTGHDACEIPMLKRLIP